MFTSSECTSYESSSVSEAAVLENYSAEIRAGALESNCFICFLLFRSDEPASLSRVLLSCLLNLSCSCAWINEHRQLNCLGAVGPSSTRKGVAQKPDKQSGTKWYLRSPISAEGLGSQCRLYLRNLESRAISCTPVVVWTQS